MIHILESIYIHISMYTLPDLQLRFINFPVSCLACPPGSKVLVHEDAAVALCILHGVEAEDTTASGED